MDPTNSHVDHERRTSMCAECGGVRANPIANLIASGLQTITYRCPSCGRTWEHTRPSKGEQLLAP